jgi:two-component system response regulator FlrC
LFTQKGAGMTTPVLIAETDPLCLSALSFMVMSLGYQPLPFSSSLEVCAALDRLDGEPAAMITEFDVNAPCDAHCIIASIRRRFPALPIIVLTADTSHAAREALENLDCHVLFKPSRPEDIVRLLPPYREPSPAAEALPNSADAIEP